MAEGRSVDEILELVRTPLPSAADPNDPARSIAGFSIPRGPADQVAFRDVQQLYIALDSVWATVLDEQLVQQLSEACYELWNYAREVLGPGDGVRPAPPMTLATFRLEMSKAVQKNNLFDILRGLEALYARLENRPLSARSIVKHALDLIDLPRRQASALAASTGAFPTEAERRATLAPPWASSAESLADLNEIANQGHTFTVFHKNAVNYGIEVEYRQEWHPGPYQTGRLVKTVPLAPGETRTYRTTRKTSLTRTESVSTKITSMDESESSSSQKDLADIQEAQRKQTDFSLNGSYSGFGASLATQVSTSASKESKVQKQKMAESTEKAANSVNQSRELEVKVSSAESTEEFAEGVLSNPNNELTVTYLFYELARRYRVFQRIRKVTPLVFVALEMPQPREITREWVLRYEWIIRRNLMDDSFEEHLDLIHNSTLPSLEKRIPVLKREIDAEKERLQEIELDIEVNDAQLTERRKEYLAAQALFSGSPRRRKSRVAARRITAAQQSTEEALEFELEDERELDEALRQSAQRISLLSERLLDMEDEFEYAKRLVDQLLLHIKDNILHYIQAIWRAEPPQQQLLRQFERNIPWPKFRYDNIRAEWVTRDNAPERLRRFPIPERGLVKLGQVLPKEVLIENRRLAEVADLGSPRGFFGNYVIYPLLEENRVTAHMLKPYIDPANGSVVDPSDDAGIDWKGIFERLSDVDEREKLKQPPNPLTETQIQQLQDAARAVIESSAVSDEVVVSSGQLFIEALPGTHPLLEDFKLRHRAVDVQRAMNETDALGLENYRMAARLAEGDTSDPSVDRYIRVDTERDPDVTLPIDEDESS